MQSHLAWVTEPGFLLLSLAAVPQVIVGWGQWSMLCFEWTSGYSSLRRSSRKTLSMPIDNIQECTSCLRVFFCERFTSLETTSSSHNAFVPVVLYHSGFKKHLSGTINQVTLQKCNNYDITLGIQKIKEHNRSRYNEKKHDQDLNLFYTPLFE